MPEERTFLVRWIRDRAKPPAQFDAMPDATLQYKGAELVIEEGG